MIGTAKKLELSKSGDEWLVLRRPSVTGVNGPNGCREVRVRRRWADSLLLQWLSGPEWGFWVRRRAPSPLIRGRASQATAQVRRFSVGVGEGDGIVASSAARALAGGSWRRCREVRDYRSNRHVPEGPTAPIHVDDGYIRTEVLQVRELVGGAAVAKRRALSSLPPVSPTKRGSRRLGGLHSSVRSLCDGRDSNRGKFLW